MVPNQPPCPIPIHHQLIRHPTLSNTHPKTSGTHIDLGGGSFDGRLGVRGRDAMSQSKFEFELLEVGILARVGEGEDRWREKLWEATVSETTISEPGFIKHTQRIEESLLLDTLPPNYTVYNRFIEVGRVVLVNYGPDAGKIAVIVDIVDHARVLVDGPTTGVERQVLNYKRFNLTDIVVKVPRAAGTHAITKALEKADIVSLWAKTSWAKKLAVRKVRENLSDFDRFKVMIAKKQKRAIIGKQFAKLRRAALKANQL
ncbi:60S ribosomal protein L14 [Rhizoclosmatium sp. JEL0117]|nr:60S ribosomal protein L14 [Rhizoclosmatium sp. JEL0117]